MGTGVTDVLCDHPAIAIVPTDRGDFRCCLCGDAVTYRDGFKDGLQEEISARGRALMAESVAMALLHWL
jgi:hypothetical protein